MGIVCQFPNLLLNRTLHFVNLACHLILRTWLHDVLLCREKNSERSCLEQPSNSMRLGFSVPWPLLLPPCFSGSVHITAPMRAQSTDLPTNRNAVPHASHRCPTLINPLEAMMWAAGLIRSLLQ